jgi:two-component system cell cycle response regulator DivK
VSARAARILVVDDNLASLKLVTFVLAQVPYDVRAAIDAEDAIDLVRRFKPRLILVDLQMPDTDGLALTRRLKADPATRDALIVAVTTDTSKGEVASARAVGVDGYITKPMEPDRFRDAVASYLTG